MNRKLLVALTIASTALLPALAIAAGGGDSHEAPHADISGLVRHGINLLLLIGILVWALKGPLSDFLNFRRNEVKDQLEASLRAKEAAEAKFAELNTRLESFESELEELREKNRVEAAAERATMMANAERAVASVEETAQRTVAEGLRRARAELKAEAVDLSVQIAEELLTKNINDDDQSRLTGDYLAKVEETARS